MKINVIAVLCSTLVSLLCSNTYADATPDAEASFTDPHKVIQVTPASPTVSLRIKSNPTTGYDWFLVDYDARLLTPVSEVYHAPQTGLMGASGFEVWTFKVKPKAFSVPQMTSITLQNVRPWVVSSNARKMSFSVVVLKSRMEDAKEPVQP